MSGSAKSAPATVRVRGIVIAAAFLAGFLWYLASRVSAGEAAAALLRADLLLLAGSVAVKATSYLARSARWATAIAAATGRRPRRRVLASAVIGFAMNLALPARLGDFARAEVMDRHNGTSKTIALTSFWLCSLIDVCLLATLLFVLSVSGALPDLVDRRLVFVTLAIGAFAITGLWAFGGTRLRAAAARWTDRRRGPGFLRRIGRRGGEALQLLHSGSALAEALAWSALVWSAEIAGTYLAMEAFRIDAGFIAAAVVTAALSLSFVVPITPGNVGTHQVICLLVLGVWGVAEAPAVMFSVGMQGAVSLTVIFAGLGFALREGLANVLPSKQSREGGPTPALRENTDADSGSNRVRILGAEARSEL